MSTDSQSLTDLQHGSANRRDFLRTALVGAGTAVGACAASSSPAAEPVVRNGKSHMKLSLAAYSYHRYLPRDLPLDRFKTARMTLDDVIQICADQNLDAVELTSYYFPNPVTTEYLIHLKEMTFRLGLDISSTAIRNDYCLAPGTAREADLAHTRNWIDYAATMGAPVIRIFAGAVPKGETESVAIARCVEGINEALDYASTKGVFLALENHGGITATPEQLLKIVRGVKDSRWFGVNLDSGNFATADPYADLEKIAPYAINVQIKVEMTHNKKKVPADLARVIRIIRNANYRGYIVLEFEGAPDPLQVVPGNLKKLRELIS
jgi:sugar phosphate isomerase/epimerase